MPNEELHRATKRVIDTLEQLTAAPAQGMTLTELASALKAPKSSRFPIVNRLVSLKFRSLNLVPGRYGTDKKAKGIVNENLGGGGLTTAIQPKLNTMGEACGETGYLANW